MNIIHRIIWSVATQSWVVVSELTTAKGKQKSAVKKVLLTAAALSASLGGTNAFSAGYNATITDGFILPGEVNTVSVNDYNVSAVRAYQGGVISTTNDLTINVGGAGASGLVANSKNDLTDPANPTNPNNTVSTINVANVFIATHAYMSLGIYATNNGLVNSSGPGPVKVKITTQGDVSAGAYANNNSTINFVDTDIMTDGLTSHGLIADAHSTITSSGQATITTLGNSSYGVYSLGADTDTNLNNPHTAINLNNVDISTLGDDAYGMYAQYGSITVSGITTIKTTGDRASGIVIDNATSKIVKLNGGSITTHGAEAHGISATGNNTYVTFGDPSEPSILPLITVFGPDSAVLHASNTGQLDVIGLTLTTAQTAGPHTWGGKAESGGRITLYDGSSGGTGLWATGQNSKIVSSNADLNGSRVKLEDEAKFVFYPMNAGERAIGSLEGEESTMVMGIMASNDLIIGVNNAKGDGSMVDGANFAGVFLNVDKLTKTGFLTQILSGVNNTVGSVDVTGGTLRFEQEGRFSTRSYYRTQAGATTDIGRDNSTLFVADTFTQDAGSNLKVTLGDGTTPDITAKNASLDGNIIINGFVDGPNPAKASVVTRDNYTLIHTTDGITGDFANNPLAPASHPELAGVDYLLHSGYVTADGKDYKLGFHMAWTDGGNAKGTGTFTVAEGTAFDVDTALSTQTGHFASGWNGNSLTKAGQGLLVLSAANTYTGTTTLNEGTLRAGTTNTIEHSSDLMIRGGVFDLNHFSQQVNRLSGTGGEITLNGAELLVHNATPADATAFSGDITDGTTPGGSLTKTGDGTLTLSGQTAWTGETHIEGGELVLDGNNNGAQLTGNVVGQDGTALSLRNHASLTGWIDPTDVSIDADSTWNMTDNSVVNTLDLAGMLNFVAPGAQPMTAAHTLTATDWNGQGGTVTLNTVLGDDTSVTDSIVVNGNTTGNTFLKVMNAGGTGAQTVEGIRVVDVMGQSDGTFTKAGRIVAGTYDYSLVKKNKSWYLTSLFVTPDAPDAPVAPDAPDAPVAPDAPDAPVAPDAPDAPSSASDMHVFRPEAGSYAANLAAANTMFITRLHDRLGETQYNDMLTGEKKVTSMWLRQVGGHTRSKDSTGQLSSQSNRYVTQLGGEIAQWSPDGLQRLHLGVMAGYGNSSSNTRSHVTGYHADGEVSGYSAGAYATWYQNDETKQGLYLDSWAQYSWFNNDVKGQDIQGESYKSSGVTASLEAGYTHKLGEFAGSLGSLNEWYIQPQVQAVWMGVDADAHTENNGTQVSSEGKGNLQTRLGLRTYLKGHNKLDDGKDRTFQPFVEVNWIHNTEAFGTRMDRISVTQSGTWDIGEIKTGVEGQINKRLQLWGNVGAQVGSKGYNDTAAMIGVKYSF